MLEGLRQDNGELKAEQRLSAGQNDSRLRQHLLNFRIRRRSQPLLGLAIYHRMLLLAGLPPVQAWKSEPEHGRHRSRSDSDRNSSQVTKNPSGGDGYVQTN